MPFRSFYLPSLESFEWPMKEYSLDHSLSDPFSANSSSLLKKDAFDLPQDEWDSWLQWDGVSEAKDSLKSRQSSGDSTYGSELCALDILSSPEMDGSGNIFAGEAQFDLDEPCISPASMQLFPKQDLNESTTNPTDNTFKKQLRMSQSYFPLSVVEEQRLRDIAMPGYDLAPTVRVKVEETTPDHPATPELTLRNQGKKRKVAATQDEDDMSDSELPQSRKQRGHNATEKRYRINLNNKIDALRLRIPNLRTLSNTSTQSKDTLEEDETMADHDTTYQSQPSSPTAVGKSGKAAVLNGALMYIMQLENSAKNLAIETVALKERVCAFEKLAAAGLVFSISSNCT